MKSWLKFLGIGLVLGLFTEAQLKLVAGINPRAFLIALAAYPVLVTLAYGGHRLIDRRFTSVWRGDVVHYLASGMVGLIIEWTLLGNPPGSDAIQLGMFGMWTTFCFGPRVLTRDAASIQKLRRRFWWAFVISAAVLTVVVLLAKSKDAKVVLVVLGLTGTYIVWSIWLLVMAWRARRRVDDSEFVTA